MDRLLALARRLPLVGAVLDVQKRFSEVHGGFLASAVTLAAFVSIFPLVLLVTAVVGFLVDLALWLWTLTVLTNRKVGWRGMLPGAVLGAVGLQVLRVAGSVYVPKAVASSSALYGPLGVVFAVLAWLLFFGRLVVYAAAVNVVRWEGRHGTVTAEIELPRVPGEAPVAVTRSGEAQPAATGTDAR